MGAIKTFSYLKYYYQSKSLFEPNMPLDAEDFNYGKELKYHYSYVKGNINPNMTIPRGKPVRVDLFFFV